MPRTVNLRDGATCTHYCGRVSSYNAARHGMYMQLGNPVFLTRDTPTERKRVCEAYEAMVRSGFDNQLERIKRLPKDAVLGCWCKPLACHVDVIIKLWEELHAQSDSKPV